MGTIRPCSTCFRRSVPLPRRSRTSSCSRRSRPSWKRRTWVRSMIQLVSCPRNQSITYSSCTWSTMTNCKSFSSSSAATPTISHSRNSQISRYGQAKTFQKPATPIASNHLTRFISCSWHNSLKLITNDPSSNEKPLGSSDRVRRNKAQCRSSSWLSALIPESKFMILVSSSFWNISTHQKRKFSRNNSWSTSFRLFQMRRLLTLSC